MKVIPWTSPWRLKYTPQDGQPVEIPARVPGNVLADIVRAGKAEDPFNGENALAFRPFEYLDFEYTSTFATPDFADGERVELVFGGVDTIAEYILDGERIAQSRNMFVEQRLDITAYTAPGRTHTLKVLLQSPVNYARRFRVPAHARAQDYNYEALYLRKARHSFGWDILPRLPGAGLWRPVRIEINSPTDWEELYLRTIQILPEGALFYLNWSLRTDEAELDDFSAELVLTCGEQRFTHRFTPRFVCGKTYFFLPDPKLWWPAGSGDAPLYEAELTLFLRGRCAAVRKFHTAVRTITLDYREKAQGAAEDRFDFIVNGRKIYIRGINHVPVNALHGENADRRFEALEAARELHCNMVRIWGGGVYEDDDFYDWCDRHGMMVWQDFMFACECPPHDDWFLHEVAEEAASILKKLRNHPSLALLCGDNECDVIHRSSSPYLPPSHNAVTRRILPEAVGEYAPETAYIPSSPFLSDEVWRASGRFLPPELHPWGDRYDWKSDYYHDSFRCAFISEVGYPGMNPLSSLKRYLPESALSVSAVRDNVSAWHVHATAPFNAEHPSFSFRVPLLLKLAERSFGGTPETFGELIEKSQIVHAEAMKTFVEMFRIHRGSKGGLMLWNLLDGWPQCSEALIDFYMERKKAFDYVKRAQQELCLILPEPVSWRAVPVMVNDRGDAAAGSWRVLDLASGEVLAEGGYSVPSGGSCELKWFDHRPKSMQILLLEWDDGRETYYNHALLGTAPYDFDAYRRCMENFTRYTEEAQNKRKETT
ncbi:MAG: hypothetical protein J5944_08215 [Lentisphaeria bacterium]|nr:hypothetical protein [Lentisphaeria bacterium]